MNITYILYLIICTAILPIIIWGIVVQVQVDSTFKKFSKFSNWQIEFSVLCEKLFLLTFALHRILTHRQFYFISRSIKLNGGYDKRLFIKAQYLLSGSRYFFKKSAFNHFITCTDGKAPSWYKSAGAVRFCA